MACDKHVVKMIVETAQILSTAHRILNGTLVEYEDIKPKFKNINGVKVDSGWITKKRKKYILNFPDMENNLYKATHINHPSSIWARTSISNYDWLYKHFRALCTEYTYRYGKIHATGSILSVLLRWFPARLKSDEFTQPPCCMPDECKITNDVVINYRYYYLKEKKHILKYTKREIPFWIEEAEGVEL